MVLLLSVLMMVSQMSFISFATEPAAPETPSAEMSGDGEADAVGSEAAVAEDETPASVDKKPLLGSSAVPHNHFWTAYDNNASKMFIVCRNQPCPDQPYEISIEAKDATYTGSEYSIDENIIVREAHGHKGLPDGFQLDDETEYSDHPLTLFKFVDGGIKKLDGAPVDAGHYYAEMYLTYNDVVVAVARDDFYITRAPLSELDVSVADWKYGETAKEPVVTNNTGRGKEKIEYKLKDSWVDWNWHAPTEAGTYSVRLTVSPTSNYNGKVITKTDAFTIGKADLSLTIKMDDWAYGAGAKAPEISGNVSGGAESLLYMKKDEGQWDAEVPTALGDYSVKVTVAATKNYNSAEGTADFRIVAGKMQPAVKVSGWTYGRYNRRVNGPKIIDLPADVKDPVVSYQVAELGNGVTMGNLEEGDFEPVNSEADFNSLDAGDYAVIAKITASPYYNDSTTRPVKLTVSKADINYDRDQLPETVKGLKYDGTAQNLVTTAGKTWDESWGDIEYAVNSGIDILPPRNSEYKKLTDSSQPQGTEANIYYVWLRVVPEDTDNYNVSEAGFRVVNIKRAEAAGIIEKNDLVYNGNKQELVTVKSENVRFRHGLFYTKEIPAARNAGTYTIHYKILGEGSTKNAYGEMAVTIDPKTTGIYWGQDKLRYEGSDQGPDVAAQIRLTGIISGDDFSFKINNPEMIDVGAYAVEISDLDNDNYVLPDEDECEHIYEIEKADLTVTAGDAVIDYGEKAPRKVALSYKGFKGDDDESCLSGTAAFSFGGYEQYDPAGNYEITVDGLYSENYDFIYAPGDLEVEKLPVTVVWSGNMAVAYDGKQHSVSAKLSGLLPRDEDNELVWVELSGDTTATAEGSYTAKAVLAGKPYNANKSVSDNYYIADGSGICKWKIVNEYDPAAEEAARAEAAANAKFLGIYCHCIPKARKVKVKAGKNSFKVSWKRLSSKQRKKYTRQEIQYCRDGKFNRKTTKVKERRKSKTSYKVKGLKKGSVYYVRVRNIKYAYDKKYVSKWSKVRKIKIK